MGLYVNPRDQSKESWLETNGELIGPTPPTWDMLAHNCSAVCLVDNGIFTAAGVAYSPAELEEFSREDGRRRVWYAVPDEKLITVVTGGDLLKWKAGG